MVRPTRELGPRPILGLGMGASYGASNVDVTNLLTAVFGYQAHGNLGSSETFDASVALWHSGTLDDDCTFTLTALASGSVTNLFLELLQDGTGGWVIDLPASVVNKTEIEADQVTTAGTTALLVLLTRDGGTTWYAGWWGQSSGGSDLTIEDEGVPLATFADTLDFVGAGVTASGTGATKTITIPGGGAPTGAAGGDLSGTYPNPDVVNDSHTHTGATIPGAVGPVLISDTHSTPIIFGDLLLTEDGSDFLYADIGA